MPSVRFLQVTADSSEQRLDNFLIKQLKGVPWSHLYRKIRKGEVRVNKKRAKPHQRLKIGDEVRVPPIHTKAQESAPDTDKAKGQWGRLESSILYESDEFLVIDKPANLPVHSGSGIKYGLIERLRAIRPDQYLELVHRLDRGTSGCLMIAKKRAALLKLQEAIQSRTVKKTYVAVSDGVWSSKIRTLNLGLKKVTNGSGDSKVIVSKEGKASRTDFKVLQTSDTSTLMQAQPVTGRMHQIRVHMSHMKCPIKGDEKYGQSRGKQRLYLHAESLSFSAGDYSGLHICSSIPSEFKEVMLDKMERETG